jgi:hypothetical protein
MTGNNMGYQSEEGGVEKGAIGGGGGSHQYSSQDSLPDSPYSSQSLDVQPLSEQGIHLSLLVNPLFSHFLPKVEGQMSCVPLHFIFFVIILGCLGNLGNSSHFRKCLISAIACDT